MTLSQSDINLSISSAVDRKIIKGIFSNILISSAVLLIILIFIFNTNAKSWISTFVYGYLTVISFNLINAKYIKDEYVKKNTSGINRDFENLMNDATSNPIIISSKEKVGFNERKNNNMNDSMDDDVDSFLNNTNHSHQIED
jgi:hypothetical protein